jgi:chromosomal replication initiator protein
MNPQQLWQATLGELELLLSKANFTTWFKNTTISSFTNEEVIISVPNGFTKEWLEKKYHQAILKALKNVIGSPIKSVIYKIEAIQNTTNSHIIPTSPEATTIQSEEVIPNKPQEVKNDVKLDNFKLNSKYIFSNFIVGKNNELAHAAALAVAENPGTSYNPLFVYGGVGLGKTHLMQAIGHAILAKNP